LSVIRFRPPRRRATAAAILCWSLCTVLGLSACSNNGNRAVTGSVGVDDGVSISTDGAATELLEDTSLGITASVPNDTTNAGVTWTLSAGVGTLVGPNNGAVTYVAPTTVSGAAEAVITATSVANPLYYAQVTLIVLGDPQLNATVLFPGNLNLGYGAELSIAGGQGPYTWALTAGALPPGLGLSSSTASVDSITGVPTTLGTYAFTIMITDSLNRTSTLPFTIQVNPQNSCELLGQYVFAWTGFRTGQSGNTAGSSSATHLGVLNIDVNGLVTGETDFKANFRSSPDQQVINGTCANTTADTGQITLNTANGLYQYNFAITAPDANGIVHSARIQLVNAASDSGSGLLELQDASALGGPAPSGHYAFGLIGVDSNALHFGSAGLFTASGGVLSAGQMDSNAASATLNDQATSGTISAPDAMGRGQLTLTAGASTTTLAYYLINAQKMVIMDIDGGAGTPVQSGFLTPQVGTASPTTFDATVLGAPSIVSLWGSQGDVDPYTVVAIGRLANGNPAANQVDLTLQTSAQALVSSDELYAAQSYTVDPTGRGTLGVITAAGLRSFVLYFDGVADGYIVEQGGGYGNAGLLEAQQVPAAGFPETLPGGYGTGTGSFVSGTQFPQSPGPVVLVPQLSLDYGQLSSAYTNGSFAIDPTSGRGLGTLTQTAVGTTPAAFYMVSGDKLDLLRYATRSTNGAIDWIIDN
jgi:hypothetical protein